MTRSSNLTLTLLLWSYVALSNDGDLGMDKFPVEATLVSNADFSVCEGIAFNGEGRLFITCDRALWELGVDGDAEKIVDLDSNLGIAGFREQDLLVADFGPTNAFRHDRNSDGVVWRITPTGEKGVSASNLGDPNFVLVLPDGTYLVSDDATNDIYRVREGQEPVLFSTAVGHPNGLLLSEDRETLYVAQTFSSIRPIVADNAVWAIRLESLEPTSAAKLLVRTGPEAANDGLAMDQLGRIYIASNNTGRVWRFDPRLDQMLLVAEGLFGVASLAFGKGDFDKNAIYATSTYAEGKGGKVWRIPVGIDAGSLYY